MSHAFIKLRRGTAAEWSASQPQPDGEILKLGEPGYEKDTRRLKIGDGVTGWNNLPYFADGIVDFSEELQDIIGNEFLIAGSGIGIIYNDLNNSLTIGLDNPTIELSDITDLSSNGRNFLLNPLSSNLSTLINDETGSGLLVFNTDPAFSGIPTVPTAPSGTNSTQIANTSFVRTEISNLVDSAPILLDTLNELAAALGDDANFATNITNSLASKANLSGAIFTGSVSIPSGTGNFNSLSVNSINVSVSGHNHVYTDITNFASGVDSVLNTTLVEGNYIDLNYDSLSSTLSISALPPVTGIAAGSNITVVNTSGLYTISTDDISSESASLVTTVFNKTGSPISKFNVVYISGGQGDMPTVSLASASGEITSSKTYGITAESISDMSTGKVVVFGALTGLDTDQFNPTAPTGDVNGTTLWLSPTTPGGVTTTKPSAPNHMVAVGTIVRTHQNQGVVEVRVQNGFELQELHNVAISGVTNGQFLQYNSGSGLWLASSSGNFSTLQLNGTGVSVSGHTHTSSSITDFNSSVSGLLPVTNISAGSGIAVSPSSGNYTITVDIIDCGELIAAVSGDPYWSSVDLLLPLNGANNSTTVTDVSNTPRTFNTNINIFHSTSIKKYGSASLSLPGSTSIATTSITNSTAIGTGDFTLELWAYRTNSQTDRGIIHIGPANDSYDGVAIGVNASAGTWGIYANNGERTGTIGATQNTWAHLAVTRTGGTTRLWVNGVQSLSVADATNYTDRTINIGLWYGGGYSFAGYIDDVRLTVGVARYTSAFTPPTEAHPTTGV